METHVLSRQEKKEKNLKLIFNIIANNSGISRIDIAKYVGFSASAVSGLTDELIFRRLIVESGTIDSGDVGRHAILLKTNPLGGFCVSVLFGNKQFQLTVFNLETKMEFRKTFQCRTNVLKGSMIIDAIEEEVQYNYKYGMLYGIVIVLPSWYSGGNGDKLMNEQFGYRLEEDCIRKVRSFYRDSLVLEKSSTILDAYYQTHESICNRNILCLTVDKEIYSSLILNGKVLKNDNQKDFGNIGLSVESDDEPAKKKGLLKSFITPESITEIICKKLNKTLSFDEVVSLFNNNDTIVKDTIEEIAHTFAYALSSFVDILNLEAIIIRGEITRLGSEFCEMIKKRFSNATRLSKNLLVKFVESGDTVMQGGAYLLFDKIFAFSE